MTRSQHDHAPINDERRERALTDDDIEALADALERTLIDRFYRDLGSGVWSLAWKAIVVAVCAIAAYGSLKGH